ncbi:MAG: S8/S53 family peptidase [Acidobacteriota bacterium]
MHDEVRSVIDEAILDNDIIVVAAAGQTFAANILSGATEAAGNLNLVADDSVILPAACPNVIAVAGCSPSGAPWSESHRGANVDITAPADAVWVAEFTPKDDRGDDAIRRQQLECASGTSFAASFMAGVAALWLAHWGRQALINRYRPRGVTLAWVFRHQLQRTANATHADD